MPNIQKANIEAQNLQGRSNPYSTTSNYVASQPTEAAIEKEARSIAMTTDPKFGKYHSFLDAQANQSNILTPTNFFGSPA